MERMARESPCVSALRRKRAHSCLPRPGAPPSRAASRQSHGVDARTHPHLARLRKRETEPHVLRSRVQGLRTKSALTAQRRNLVESPREDSMRAHACFDSRYGLLGLAVLIGSLAACASRNAPAPVEPAAEGSSAEQADSPHPTAAPREPGQLPENLTVEHIAPGVAAARTRRKAKCWQPALDSRGADAPTDARVTVSAVIDPSGTVNTVETDEPSRHYPKLSSCVAGVVRSMKFPQATKPTSVNIPF